LTGGQMPIKQTCYGSTTDALVISKQFKQVDGRSIQNNICCSMVNHTGWSFGLTKWINQMDYQKLA